MKHNLIIFIFLLALSGSAFSQTTKVLTKTETENLKNEIKNIPFPIYKAYEYKDNGGLYSLLLCENQIKIDGSDSIKSKIVAICYLKGHGGYVEKWKISDALDTSDDTFKETNIRFWTKYCSASDIDGDKLIEPIIVYGTKIEDRINRIKIITIYKGNKYVIRAVECGLDDCRTLKKDDKFKYLPKKVKLYIDNLLEEMRIEEDVILSDG